MNFALRKILARRDIATRTVIFLGLVVVFLLTSFFAWPGQWGGDFATNVYEAQTLNLQGHQSPVAAIALHWVEVAGLPADQFVYFVKLLALFSVIGILLFTTKKFALSLLLIVFLIFPLLWGYLPILRLNLLVAYIIVAALSFGLIVKSKFGEWVSYLLVVFASLFSSGFVVGYFFAVSLVRYCRSKSATSAILFGFIICAAVFSTAFALEKAYNAPNRSSTLYVSKLADIIGLYAYTGEVCLDASVTRGDDPAAIIERSYVFGVPGYTIWDDERGFLAPAVTEEVYSKVNDCWKRTITENKLDYVRYKIQFMIKTIGDGWYENPPSYRDNALVSSMSYSSKLVINSKIGGFLFYGLIFLLCSILSIYKYGTKVVFELLLSWGIVAGFCVPHLVFGQHAIARYLFTATAALIVLSIYYSRTLVLERGAGQGAK